MARIDRMGQSCVRIYVCTCVCAYVRTLYQSDTHQGRLEINVDTFTCKAHHSRSKIGGKEKQD